MNPKPFIRLVDGLSFIQHAYQKAALVGNIGQMITVTNKELLFRAKADFEELTIAENFQNDYILEPQGRNTAPAIAMAALHAKRNYGNDVCLLILAADHLMRGMRNLSKPSSKQQL
ncbi:sugar phosphate nucleotidyltransferase [Faucicola atlantae]|uniref:sugar phosphate nucleotidyltransferase n=1 Tax=Faucicola atlantae TaxID=34059 RepID=UPI0025AED6A9|nr:sugar phosphate nucleotidyltransferase [Moraxella atlantae]